MHVALTYPWHVALTKDEVVELMIEFLGVDIEDVMVECDRVK